MRQVITSLFSPRMVANMVIGFEALVSNKIRSILTALGVVFGVAAVIAMLAIGNGAQQELLEQMKQVGVNNIIIKPTSEKQNNSQGSNTDNGQNNNNSGSNSGNTGSQGKKEQKKFSPGLSMADVEAIKTALPDLVRLSPEVMLDQTVVSESKSLQSKTIGVWNTYFNLGQLQLSEGQLFSNAHQDEGAQVCIIGKGIRTKLFPGKEAIGKQIKVGKHWLKIIGVYEFKAAKASANEKLGIRDYNQDVCIPLKTMMLRYTNRILVTESKIRAAEEEEGDKKSETVHQLDRIVVQVNESSALNPCSDVLSRLLLRRHNQVLDYEITIPELLLKQQERTKDIFNIVLGAIAGISLLVGGIGIMNIMLASVLERIKEIGLRISLGAKRSDIVMQFLVEAVLIASFGGVTGIVLGVSMAWAVTKLAQIPTAVSGISIFISFSVAALVGLIFGITPARRAASQNPIESLRYE